jgi:hypothetical protein
MKLNSWFFSVLRSKIDVFSCDFSVISGYLWDFIVDASSFRWMALTIKNSRGHFQPMANDPHKKWIHSTVDFKNSKT